MTDSARLPRPLITANQAINSFLALMLSLGCISFIEPSPYDGLFPVFITVALLGGIAITRVTLLLFFIVLFYLLFLWIALIPYFVHRPITESMTPLIYSVVSSYMFTMAFMFALIFSRNTKSRIDIALKAYAFSCAFAGIWVLLSYFNVAGIGAREPVELRFAGPFKDPNVSGSYCVMGALYFLEMTILGSSRRRLLYLIGLLLSVAAVFLSYSRGSWLAFIFSAVFLLLSIYITADGPTTRRKITVGAATIVITIAIVGLILASNDTIRETFATRFQLVQYYDAGNGGRFGNQVDSIAMLIERPFGFGPFRFPLFFGLQPHNSYIGAFASAGWGGGFVFLFFMLLTGKVAVGLCFKETPFRRHAQIVCAAFLTVMLQAFQIDIDHWRFAFLMMGMVWGLESARLSSPLPVTSRKDAGPPGTKRLLANERF